MLFWFFDGVVIFALLWKPFWKPQFVKKRDKSINVDILWATLCYYARFGKK